MNNLQQTATPPGNFGLPILGETLDFLRDPNFQTKRLQKYGKIFKTHIFNRPTVVMTGAEANQFLFKNENKYVRATWTPSTRILLGNSLATQQGNFHLSRRKMLYDAFQPRALESYIPTMETMTRAYLERWEQQQELTWYPELRNYTFDVASKLFVGKDQASQTPLGQWFEEWVRGLFSLPINLPWTTFGKAFHCRQKMLTEIEKIIIERQENPDLIAQGKDALSLLLQAKDEEGKPLSLSELKDQILLLLFAGHETLTSSLVSFCLLMAQYPEVLAKIRQEQQELNLSFPLTLEQLKKMTYLEQVLKEVLRLIPPVGGGFREVIEPFEYQGYHIPQGWIIQYQIGYTHQDQSLYDQPQNFDPDRFAPERTEDKQSSFGYIPFGGGLRECIGKEFARLEMRILATLLAHQYQWELLPDQDLSLRAIPSPAPKDGLKVRFCCFIGH